jgi:hypothetical protein
MQIIAAPDLLSGDWKPHGTFFSHWYHLLDGRTVRTNFVMRRKRQDGKWDYREATEAEASDWNDRLQW